MTQFNKNKIYFTADKFGRISIFDEKPNNKNLEKQFQYI